MRCLLFVLLLFPLIFSAQTEKQIKELKKPKLVIGIVVDQMRYDYIYRFWDDFGQQGFKRLIKQGFFCRNANFSYSPTFTGPGHASIFSGSTPSTHGIIANNWFDKETKTSIYCAGDGNMETICNCEKQSIDVISEDGKMSPHHMLTSTIGDEMKLFNPTAKIFGVSLKDRGAILSAGHSANAAYWMDSEGQWITSSYYMEELPKWMIEYQEKNPTTKWLQGEWSVEGKFTHNLDNALLVNGPSAIKTTPFGNTVLNELAIEILKQEDLGKRKVTDFLSISFSSTDYIGHKYGPHAPEIKDTYIRLDQDISRLLKVIDKIIGMKNVVVFLTADHGVVSEPRELKKRKIPAGYFDKLACKASLEKSLNTKYGSGNWVLNFSNGQVFLNHELINQKNISLESIQEYCANFLIKINGIKRTYTAKQMNENTYDNPSMQNALIQKGFNQKRSGDVIVVLEIGWIGKHWEKGGTTHGSSFSYDTHIPLIFWGGLIPRGQLDRPVYIRDIAPTISTLLGISYPNGCTGDPIPEITE